LYTDDAGEMMAAPKQVKRDLKAPLSKSRRSGSQTVVFVLGVLGLAAVGGFLFIMSLQSANNDVQADKGIAKSEKKEEIVWKTKNVEKISNIKKTSFEVEDTATISKVDEETVVISTKHGKLKIVLRPDLSKESVEYIRQIVNENKCKRCNLYRAEKPGILQGIIDGGLDMDAKVTKGKCPPGFESKKQECPAHDPQCGCHGPIMTKGMVGWAGGDTGPDFFIDSYERPAKFWGNQHTVFGQIRDDASFAVIEKIYELPATNKGGMTFIDEKIQFMLSLE
jgi:cyclophilin family peptidyl-prolyl cis-trans isomerase